MSDHDIGDAKILPFPNNSMTNWKPHERQLRDWFVGTGRMSEDSFASMADRLRTSYLAATRRALPSLAALPDGLDEIQRMEHWVFSLTLQLLIEIEIRTGNLTA